MAWQVANFPIARAPQQRANHAAMLARYETGVIQPLSIASTATVGTPTLLHTAKNAELFIGATSYNSAASTFRITKTLSAAWSGACDVFSFGGTQPDPGDEVAFFWNGTKRFGGVVLSVEEEAIPGDFQVSLLHLTFTGFQSYTERVIVANLYTQTLGGLPGIIVYEFWRVYLQQFGVTKTGDAGPALVLPNQLFHYVTGTELLNRMKAASPGYDWWIDDDKELHFELTTPTGATAPFTLRDSDRNVDTMTVRRSNSRYRNKQWVLPSVDLVALRIDSDTGDGVTTSFATNYVLTATPIVKVNDVVQVVGELFSLPAGWECYYINGGIGVFFRVAPGAALSVEISYPNPFPLGFSAQDDVAIAAKGLYEAVYQAKNVSDQTNCRGDGAGVSRPVRNRRAVPAGDPV